MKHSFIYKFTILSLCLSVIGFGLSYSLYSSAHQKPYPDGLLSQMAEQVLGEETPFEEVKTLKISNRSQISLSSKETDIEIIPHSGQEIKLKLSGLIYTKNKVDSLLSVSQAGSDFTIKVKHLKTKGSYGSITYNLDSSHLKLSVLWPKNMQASMDVRTGSGDLNIKSISLDSLEVKTGSGDISLNSLTGKNLTVGVGSGDVYLKENSFQTIKAKAGSGDLKLYKNQGALTVKTGSGDVELTPNASPDIKISTGSGDIEAYLAKTNNYRLKVNTGSGDIESDLKQLSQESIQDSVDTIIGTKPMNQKISLKTGSGDVELKDSSI